MNTPQWIAHYTTTSGMPDPRTARRAATPHTCTECHHLTLQGFDHHRITALAVVDPYALTPAQETTAILTDTPTYQLNGQPPQWELTERTHPGVPIVGKLPPATECVVLAAHKCGTPPLSDAPIPTRAPRPTPREQEPPY